MSRELSTKGLELIKSFEGLRLKAYKCLPTEQYYTIGYGHYGSDVTANMSITKTKAEELLKKDCEKFVRHVNNYMPKYNFNQNQFDALVSFAYNVGSINQLTASGTRTISQISEKILAYNKSGGKFVQGLATRRGKEKVLFDTPTTSTSSNNSRKKTVEEIAREVIDGKWGNGDERKQRLLNEGYSYVAVQRKVNALLKEGK